MFIFAWMGVMANYLTRMQYILDFEKPITTYSENNYFNKE